MNRATEKDLFRIPVADLNVDYDYQRVPKPADVNHFAENWNKDAEVSVIVNERPNGSFFVIDGWHRVCGVRKRNPGAQVLCKVLHMKTVKEEAALFIDINDHQRRVSSGVKYQAGIKAEDPEYMALNEAIQAAGMGGPNGSGGPVRFRAIKAGLEMLKSDAELFHDVLLFVVAIHGSVKGTASGHLVRAIFDAERDARKMEIPGLLDHPPTRKHLLKAGPDEIKGDAAAVARLNGAGNNWAKSFKTAVMRIANKGRQSNRRFPIQI